MNHLGVIRLEVLRQNLLVLNVLVLNSCAEAINRLFVFRPNDGMVRATMNCAQLNWQTVLLMMAIKTLFQDKYFFIKTMIISDGMVL